VAAFSRFDLPRLAPFLAGAGSLLVLWTVGHGWLDDLGSYMLRTAAIFVWLFGVILWCAVAVMRHAEVLAHRLGEPLGALILTLSAISIEVSIIAVIMLVGEQNPELARDTMFAILMIILGGLVGIALLAGGFRHRVQSYNLEGARSFMVIILPLATVALILPNYTLATVDPTLDPLQGALFATFTLLLYGVFLLMQTRRHRDFFQEPEATEKRRPGRRRNAATPAQLAAAEPVVRDPQIPVRSIPFHATLLFLTLLPIPLLAHEFAIIVEFGIFVLDLPPAMAGVLVATLVLTPEGMSAIKAAWDNQMQRSVNLLLGSALSTIGLTVPAVLVISLLTGQRLVLGLKEEDALLLVLTLIVSSLTFGGARTDMLKGAVHLLLFAVFVVLIIDP
jgi:Ca2+:H+ antiporter